MSKTTVTSLDVAIRANVSQSAVSRTFTPGASVSQQTRERVLKAANELGYRPNALARAMISGRSKLVALLAAYLDNQFYPVVLERLSRALQADGYHVLLFMTEPGRQDDVVQQMLQYQVEGVVMASATLSADQARECALAGIPVVLFNRHIASSPASSVTTNNIEGGRQAAQFLIDGGHERIAYIAGLEDSSTNLDREAGFIKGLEAHGRQVFVRAVGGYTFEGAAEATRRLFALAERPDAVFVANDHMAFAVVDVLRHELKLDIPGEVSVIGYDDVPAAAWAGYRLTTVSQSIDQMTEATASILLEQIENQTVKGRAVVLPARLIVRETARIP